MVGGAEAFRNGPEVVSVLKETMSPGGTHTHTQLCGVRKPAAVRRVMALHLGGDSSALKSSSAHSFRGCEAFGK